MASRGYPSSEPWQGDLLARGSQSIVQVDIVNNKASSVNVAQVEDLYDNVLDAVVQVENVNYEASSADVAQVDNVYYKAPCANLVQVDNCYTNMECDVAQVVQLDNVHYKASCTNLVQVEDCYTNPMECDVVQLDNVFIRPTVKGRTVAQVDHSLKMSPSTCDLVQVEELLLTANTDGNPVVQVENLFNVPTHCVENVTDIDSCAQDIALVQVDHLMLNTSTHDGVIQAQVDDSHCNTSANGNNISSSENVIATPSGSDLVQVVDLYNSATGGGSD